MSELAGVSYPRLVPSSLLPPEDPSRPQRKRNVRDWIVDITALLLAAGCGVFLIDDSISSASGHVPEREIALDWVLGTVAIVAIWWRRRRPLVIAVGTAVLSAVSAFAAAAAVLAMFTAAVHRRTTVAASVGLLNVATGVVFGLYRPQTGPWWVSLLVSGIVSVVVVAWGMVIRARRQLVWTLRERAERAEAEQLWHAEQARQAERTRIAREMHDVLAHRISLLALHAGGLTVRPDLPSHQVAETGELLRATAHRALEELRDVIGVLRDGTDDAPAQPQPTLCDIPRLVDETRRTGAKIEFRMALPDEAEPPDVLGRDAYRIVQEALTNVAKHAAGTATTVEVCGAPGTGLRVMVRNRLPLGTPAATIPGSGSGLVGLHERVALAGGTLTHGPNDAGEFVVAATLTWP